MIGTQEKSDAEILFPEREVEGFKIRPWSFGQICDMGDIFQRVLVEARKSGISLEETEKHVPELVTMLLPHAPRIIAGTVGIDEKAVREWPLNKATVILLAIIEQNFEHIKNSFGLGRLAIKMPKVG